MGQKWVWGRVLRLLNVGVDFYGDRKRKVILVGMGVLRTSLMWSEYKRKVLGDRGDRTVTDGLWNRIFIGEWVRC